jgi:hypothetical protein
MRIREENRNIFLLATVTLCCGVVAGTATLLEPVFAEAPAQVAGKQVVGSRFADGAIEPPVRVVGGTIFVPNVNPRER